MKNLRLLLATACRIAFTLNMLTVLSLASFALAPAASAQSKEAVAKRNQAIALYNAQKYREAGKLLDEYNEVAPNDYYGFYYNALCGQQTGNMGKAKACYRQVVQLAPSSQFGQYSQSILSRIDPQGGSGSISRSNSNYDSGGSRLTGGGIDNGLDTSIPREWDVPCLRGPDGQIFVNALVEGKPIRLMFDTGAPTCFFGKNQLEATGIPVPAGPPNTSTSGSTSATRVPAWSLKMRVKLGEVERRVTTLITDHNSAEPLVGQTYFGGFLYTIDAGAGRIHFKQKVLDTGDNRFATNVPFIWQEQGNRIIVEIEINGRKGKALFDTGNTASALSFFTVDQATQFGIKIPDDAEVSISTGISGSAAVKRFHVGRIRMGAIDRSDVQITVGDAHGPGEYPMLGAPFWQGYEYTINKEKRQIQFVRR